MRDKNENLSSEKRFEKIIQNESLRVKRINNDI